MTAAVIAEDEPETSAEADCDGEAADQAEWLWPCYIPRGEVTLVVGQPGVGKSYFMADLAARTTSGAGWPLQPEPILDPEADTAPRAGVCACKWNEPARCESSSEGGLPSVTD